MLLLVNATRSKCVSVFIYVYMLFFAVVCLFVCFSVIGWMRVFLLRGVFFVGVGVAADVSFEKKQNNKKWKDSRGDYSK